MAEKVETLLVRYLKKVQLDKGFTLNKFAEYLDINPSILSRVLSGISEPSDSTKTKIAQKLGLENIVNLEKRAEVESSAGFSANQIKLGIPYDISAFNVLSLIKRDRLPNDIVVTFCGSEENLPFFIKQEKDLTAFEDDPQAYAERYHEGNLIKMFENGLIDCMIIPQLLQNKMLNNHMIEVAEIIEGWNVCLYIVKKQTDKNISFDENSLDDLLSLLNKQKIDIAYLQNTIVEHQLNTFLNLQFVQEKCPSISDNLTRINTIHKNYFEEVVEKILLEENFTWILVGLEPFANNTFNQYFGTKKDHSIYYRFNLSKIINKKIVFSLFASRIILENTFKLRLIKEFLNRLSSEHYQTEGINIFNNQMASLFFSEPITSSIETSKINRLNKALKELNFSTTYKYSPSFVDIILEKVK